MSIDTGQNLTYNKDFPVPNIDQPSDQYRYNFSVIKTAIENIHSASSANSSIFALTTSIDSLGAVHINAAYQGNAFKLPFDTSTSSQGLIRYNSSSNVIEFNTGSAWFALLNTDSNGRVTVSRATVTTQLTLTASPTTGTDVVNLAYLNTAVAASQANSTAAYSALLSLIQSNAASLIVEINRATGSEADLQSQINAISTAVSSSNSSLSNYATISALNNAVASEANSRSGTDANLQSQIADLQNALSTQGNTQFALIGDLTNEIAYRIANDALIAANVVTVAAAVNTVATTLQASWDSGNAIDDWQNAQLNLINGNAVTLGLRVDAVELTITDLSGRVGFIQDTYTRSFVQDTKPDVSNATEVPFGISDGSLWFDTTGGNAVIKVYNSMANSGTGDFEVITLEPDNFGGLQYVKKIGDTMTGNLTISNATPSMILNGVANVDKTIVGQVNGLNRWALIMGGSSNPNAEGTYLNAGSELSIVSYKDDGTMKDVPLWIWRDNGQVKLNNGLVAGTMIRRQEGSHEWPSATSYQGAAIHFEAGSNAAIANVSTDVGGFHGGHFRIFDYTSNKGAYLDIANSGDVANTKILTSVSGFVDLANTTVRFPNSNVIVDADHYLLFQGIPNQIGGNDGGGITFESTNLDYAYLTWNYANGVNAAIAQEIAANASLTPSQARKRVAANASTMSASYPSWPTYTNAGVAPGPNLEFGLLRIFTTNDFNNGVNNDSMAIEPAASLYLNPGFQGGGQEQTSPAVRIANKTNAAVIVGNAIENVVTIMASTGDIVTRGNVAGVNGYFSNVAATNVTVSNGVLSLQHSSFELPKSNITLDANQYFFFSSLPNQAGGAGDGGFLTYDANNFNYMPLKYNNNTSLRITGTFTQDVNGNALTFIDKANAQAWTGIGGFEYSALRIGTTNDSGETTVSDSMALEPAADLYLNPGWSGFVTTKSQFVSNAVYGGNASVTVDVRPHSHVFIGNSTEFVQSVNAGTGNVWMKGNLAVANTIVYANDAAADADPNLPSGGLYRTTAGNRTIFQKP